MFLILTQCCRLTWPIRNISQSCTAVAIVHILWIIQMMNDAESLITNPVKTHTQPQVKTEQVPVDHF